MNWKKQRRNTLQLMTSPSFLFSTNSKASETKSITPSTGMKDCLYDLSIALTDCILFLEKRKMKINKDSSQGQGQGQGQGQRQGHYSLPELWFLCKTKRKLIHIKKKLEQTSLSAVTDVATTSSSSGSLSFDGPTLDNDFYYLEDQANNIEKLVRGTRELDEEGFSKEIGIVGIGGCGKTLVARMVFDNSDDVDSYDYESRIWINLQAIQKGEVDFKEILKAMLKQCDGVDGSVEVEEEEVLEALCKALWSKSYLLVFDGIWDINLDWYFRLKERLQWCNKSNQSRLIIITTRLHGVAKRMVGPNNLYRMQPFSNRDIWNVISEHNIPINDYFFPKDHPIVVKMKDEMIYHSHGLPLAATTFSTIMENRHIAELMEDDKLVLLSNDQPQRRCQSGNDLLLSLRSIRAHVVPQLPLRMVFGGDATTNRVLRAVCDMELHLTPPIGLMPLGTQVNISISLGWGNQLSDTDSRPGIFLPKLRDAEEILIDSWNFVVRTSIPNCLEIPNTLHVRHVSRQLIAHGNGGDKDLCGRFWNYLIIGLDAQELFDASHFKSWPSMKGITSLMQNIALPISVKIKDHQHQWKKLNLPQSIRSIVCLNMPSFPGGLDPWGKPNFRRKKEMMNFEIIGFRDSWHGEIFLPLNDHGTRLAHQIRFELHKGVINCWDRALRSMT
ncbi:hypothetical protein AAG906_018065 [Vitis piasezkii]